MDDGSQLLKALNVLMLKILVRNFPPPFYTEPKLEADVVLYAEKHFCAIYLLTSDCHYRIMQIELHPLLS